MGPLGVVVIVVVVVCLVSSAWLCLMMHRRTQASTSMAAQVWDLPQLLVFFVRMFCSVDSNHIQHMCVLPQDEHLTFANNLHNTLV